MPHKFGINSPYHARWVPSVKHISRKAFFKHALGPAFRIIPDYQAHHPAVAVNAVRDSIQCQVFL